MSSDAVKQYRQDFALCVLLRAPRPLTASEVSEHIQVLAMGEGHEKALWTACNPAAVAGVLRTLEIRDLVDKGEPRNNGRKGRAEPTWSPRQELNRLAPLPVAPSEAEIAAGARGDDGAGELPAGEAHEDALSPVQMLAVLEVHDRLAGSVSRFLRDLDEQREFARRRLQGVGLKVPG